jgi:hypothetical protein
MPVGAFVPSRIHLDYPEWQAPLIGNVGQVWAYDGTGYVPTSFLLASAVSAYGLTLASAADAAAARIALALGTSATLNVGTGANQIVQLDGSARLPAVDGSQLTGITVAAAGSNTQVIYNDGGVYAGDAGLTYNASTDRLTVAGGLVTPGMRPASNGTSALGWFDAVGAQFVYGDTVNRRIGIKTSSPQGDLSLAQTNGGDGIYIQRGSNSLGGTGYIFRLQDNGGTNTLWSLDTKGNVASVGVYSVSPTSNNAGTLFSVGNTSTLNNTYPAFVFRNYYTTGGAGSMLLIGGKTDSSGSRFTALDIAPHISQSGTNGFAIVRITPYLAATGSGTKNLIDLGTNTAADGGGTHTTAFAIGSDGKIKTDQAGANTNTPSGATAHAMPIYNVAGTLLGYIPIYASAW